jgi:hypothetical protein
LYGVYIMPEYSGLDKIRDILRGYAIRGKYLFDQIDLLHTPATQILPLLRQWIIDVTDQIFPIMPDQCPERTELETIRSIYDACATIIPSGIKNHILCVIRNLRIADSCMIDFLTADPNSLPLKTSADIEYDRLKSLLDTVRTHLLNDLKGKEDGKTVGTAMLHTYGRIYCYVDGMLRLNQVHDFFALSGCLRSILELYLDLRILEAGLIENPAEKYFEFPNVQKLKVAKTITNIRQECGLVSENEEKPMEKFLKEIEERETQVPNPNKTLWVNNKGEPVIPKSHWTNLDLIGRMKKIDDKIILSECLNTYYYCNWYVHSMYADYPAGKLEDTHRFMWYLYHLGGDLFAGSTKIINNWFKTMNPADLDDELSKIEQLTHKLYFGELVKVGRSQQ